MNNEKLEVNSEIIYEGVLCKIEGISDTEVILKNIDTKNNLATWRFCKVKLNDLTKGE